MDPLEIIFIAIHLSLRIGPLPSVQLQALLWILSAPGATGHRHPPNLRPFRRDENKRKGLPRPLSTLPWPDMRCTKSNV